MHYLVYIRYLWCEPGLITIYNIILTTPPSSWSSVLKDHEFPSATIMKKMVSGGQYDMLSYSKSVVYTGIKAIKSIKTVNGVMCRLTCIIGGKYFRYWTYCPDMNNHNKLFSTFLSKTMKRRIHHENKFHDLYILHTFLQ